MRITATMPLQQDGGEMEGKELLPNPTVASRHTFVMIRVNG